MSEATSTSTVPVEMCSRRCSVPQCLSEVTHHDLRSGHVTTVFAPRQIFRLTIVHDHNHVAFARPVRLPFAQYLTLRPDTIHTATCQIFARPFSLPVRPSMTFSGHTRPRISEITRANGKPNDLRSGKDALLAPSPLLDQLRPLALVSLRSAMMGRS